MSVDGHHVIPVGRIGQVAATEPVGPALIVRVLVRPMTRLLNPIVVKLAGRKHFRMAAQIRHVGRRSGRTHATPAGARLNGATIVIPLTFGNRSDWVRNVIAAGGCTVRLNGRVYAATGPELRDVLDAEPVLQSAFSPLERASFRLLGIKQVMTLHAEPNQMNRRDIP